jgi:hypothetical protein
MVYSDLNKNDHFHSKLIVCIFTLDAFRDISLSG